MVYLLTLPVKYIISQFTREYCSPSNETVVDEHTDLSTETKNIDRYMNTKWDKTPVHCYIFETKMLSLTKTFSVPFCGCSLYLETHALYQCEEL